jgi:DNA-binding transcriptional regulator YiaG
VYHGLGFPITLVNAPMKKVLGEWIVDIDMNKLQLVVLRALVFKPARLTKQELKFIRQYLFMTTTNFGRIFGVSHAAVVNWEKGVRQISPAGEFCIRLYVLNHIQAKDKEFRCLYDTISLEKLSKGSTKIVPLKIDAQEELKIAL